jgi:hypothetical protein
MMSAMGAQGTNAFNFIWKPFTRWWWRQRLCWMDNRPPSSETILEYFTQNRGRLRKKTVFR